MPRIPTAGQPDSSAGLLNLQEVSDRLGVHYMTAYRYVRTGRLPAIQIGSHWFVDPRDLRRVRAGAGVAGRPRAATRRSARQASGRRLENRLGARGEAAA